MRKLFYYFLAWPWIAIVAVFQFFVWEIIDTSWKYRFRVSNPMRSEDASVYIQKLLKDITEEKRRGGDLHDYYQRQLDHKDAEIRRLSLRA